MAKKQITKIAAIKAKAKNKPSKARQKADKKNGGEKGNAAQKAKAAAPKTGNYEKRSDGFWYHKISGKKVTKAGTVNLLENKKDFPKGVSGNPKGRPKGRRNRSTMLRELLELKLIGKNGKPIPNPLNPNEKDITVEKAVMASLIKKALKGDVAAIREIQDTMYGKMKEKTEISAGGGLVISDDLTPKEAQELYLEVISGKVKMDETEEDEEI